MYDTKHISAAATLKDQGDDAGSLEAVISTFNVVDSDNDIVEPSAFTAGQEVPLVWSHDWDRPVGKGQIAVTGDHAIFKGRFFLDTQAGREAYQTVKAMGALQEYSWGFRILDADFAERDGREVRVIKRTEVFEASPVLIGANRKTGTLSIKSGDTLAADAAAIVAAMTTLTDRACARHEVRIKEGRTLSTANREVLADLVAAFRPGLERMEALLSATEPTPRDDPGGADVALLELLAFDARRLGVAV